MSNTNSTPLTPERLREVLDYDPMTGVFSWKFARRGVRAGSTPGSILQNGYSYIRVDRTSYLTHRLVWLWVNGCWPDNHIDHIDGNRTNNRIENLRDASRSINNQNQRRAHLRSTSTMLGVYKDKKKWNAKIGLDGEVYNLGNYSTKEEAHEAYLGAKRLIHPGCTI